MIRVLLSERIKKTADKLPPDVREKAAKAIGDVAAAFGNPHQHRGLGLRKLAGAPMKSACICNGGWFLFMMGKSW